MKFAEAKFSFVVYGRRALWTTPDSRLGGEKRSYPVPTFEGIKGIFKSIYWKPTFLVIPEKVRIMAPIRTESISVKLRRYHDDGCTLSRWMYLKDPSYQVEGRIEWNLWRPEFAKDRDMKKHVAIFRRALENGGRRDIFLGSRECQALVEPCKFGEGASAYDGTGEIPFGAMFHSFGYPDETGTDVLEKRIWPAVCMKDGIIDFPAPGDHCLSVEAVRPMKAKRFDAEDAEMSSSCQTAPTLDAGE